MGKNVDLLVSESLLCCDSSVRLFSSKCKGFSLPTSVSMVYYGELFRNTERQKKIIAIFWVMGYKFGPVNIQMVNNSKDKNGSVKLIEFRSLLELNSHR